MKTLRIIIIILSTLILPKLAASDNSKFYHLSLCEDITTDGNIRFDRHNLSIGVLTTTDAALNGFELTLMSSHRPVVNGFQISAGSNIADQKMQGMQIAVGANIVLNNMRGSQISLSNFAVGLDGSQLGCYNQTRTFTGTQIGGINNSRSFKGIQLGSLNIDHEDFTGAQIGLINFAGKVNGMQLGIFNFAKSNQDLAFGLINFIKDGYYSSDFCITETGIPYYAFRHGTDNFYTAISIGLKRLNDPVFWMSGLTIGKRKLVKIFEFDFNLSAYNVNEDTLFETHNLNLLNQLKATFGINIFGNVVLYGGVTVNNFVSDKNNGESIYKNAIVYNNDGSNKFVRTWVGYVFGARF